MKADDGATLLKRIRQGPLPRHVGVIMDGNGRWAEAQGLSRAEGHKAGVERVRELIPFAANEVGLEVLTLYVFSLENWQRPESEIGALMVLLEYFLSEEVPLLLKNNVRFRMCGDASRLPKRIQALTEEALHSTASCSGMVLNAALSYGGRDEIVRAVRKIVESQTAPQSIDEELLSRMMDTAGLPDPDLIIRTSGECRTSNFLLWQAAYSELYFTPCFWPDFHELEFLEALADYQIRDRRYGALTPGIPKDTR